MTVHLVLGGARSGKSRYAETTALAGPDPVYYVATAEARDEEMADRLRHHRAHRDPRFQTVECPLELAASLSALDAPGTTVLIDCLTLWLSNWLADEHIAGWQAQRSDLLSALQRSTGRLLLVSNEVGQGVVPMGALSRRFVDEAGRLHQDIARIADQVTWVVAGLPQRLK